jgi:hypothetical protein
MSDMAADLDITSMSEYGEAMAAFRAEKLDADQAGDAAKAAQADAKLQRTLSGLKDRKFAAIQASQALSAARAAAQAKYPKVNLQAFEHVTDPATVDAYVANLQAMIDGGQAPVGGGQQLPQPQPESQSWGGAPPTSQNGVPSPEPDDWRSMPQSTDVEYRAREQARVAHMAKLSPVVLEKGRNAMAENRELRRTSVAPLLDKVLANASVRAGFDVETGEAL